MQIRAVIFDYGMVLSGPPDTSIQQELVHLSGLPHAQAEALYRKYRRAYDQGILSGVEYWQQIFADAGIQKTSAEIAHMAALDARMWTTHDPALLQWQKQLKQSGLKTAILSNIGDVVKESIVRTFSWIQNFDVLIWSYEHKLLKPDPAIYRLALDRLHTSPAETLFIDDIEENIQAARVLGIHAILYSSASRLREQLMACEMAHALPLPA